MPYKHHNTIRLGRSRHLALLDMKKLHLAIVVGVMATIAMIVFAVNR